MNKKLCLTEKNVLNFIRKHIDVIMVIVVTILAILLRKCCINFISNDYSNYLKVWFNDIKNIGNVTALKNQIGNYNETYMWIMYFLTLLPLKSLASIKLTSMLFDFIGALVASLLVYNMLKNSKNRVLYSIITYFLIILSPNVIFNSAVWGQCDFIYATFAILALLFLVKEKYLLSFIMLGISFAFKQQVIFLLPVFIIVYISRNKFPLYYFLIPILVNLIFCIPSMIIGKSLWQCISIYINQQRQYGEFLTLNFPNIYNIIGNSNELGLVANIGGIDFAKFGIIFTLIIFALLFWIIFRKKIYLSNDLIIEMSIWSVVICTCFLPHMHDRYMFLADIISIIYFMVYRKNIYIPLIINFVSFSTYIRYLFRGFFLSSSIVALINVIFIILFSGYVFRKLLKFNNNILLERNSE